MATRYPNNEAREDQHIDRQPTTTEYRVTVLCVDNEAGKIELGGVLDRTTIEVKNVLDIGKAVAELCEPGVTQYDAQTTKARDGLYIVTLTFGGVAIVCAVEQI